MTLDGASDHGVSEALYLRDPDGNGVELYWDRPRDDWPRAGDGTIRMVTAPLDVRSLRTRCRQTGPAARLVGTAPSEPPPIVEPARARAAAASLRARLLSLHKVLLDDARAAYEMDRGRIGSTRERCCSS